MTTVQEKVSTSIFGVLDRVWTSVCWPLIGLLNMFFRPDPQTGHVALWKVALWLTANAVILYLAVVDLNSQPLFWTLLAFLLVHILIIAGSLRIMYEEKQVMEGSLAADKMTFSALDAVNNVPILASSTPFYIFGVAALIQTVEHTGLAQILRNRPTLNNEYGEYLACVLNEIPIVNSVVNAWANLVDLSDNLSAQIVYNGWTGNAVRLFIVVTLSIIVVRALLLRLAAVEPPAVDGARAGERHRQSGQREEASRARADDAQQPPDEVGADASRHRRAPARARRHGAARGSKLCP